MEQNLSAQSNNDEIEATLAEHRAWTYNRFKEQNGAHVVARSIRLSHGATHVFPIRTVRNGTMSMPSKPLCGAGILTVECEPVIAVWPTCKRCASVIYSLVKTSLPEETSVESDISGISGQLVLPGSEKW